MAKRLFFHLEDNRIAQKLLARTLERFGECRGFKTIHEAEAYLREKPEIDAFFVDYTLSDGTGLSLVRRIRSMDQYNHVPIILLTSTLTNDVAYKSMRAGVNISISKLTSPSALRRIVARQVKRPYVQLYSREFYEVWCATWEKDQVYYQYCPETEDLITAGTPEDAEKKMREKLEEIIFKEKRYPDSILNLDAFAHRIKLESFLT